MKKIITFVAAFMMMAAMSITAFADGQWMSDANGWWWAYNDGGYPVNEWKWIDGNADGISECYYFGSDGYMLANTTTPDGYMVDADGAWTDGNLKYVHQFIPEIDEAYQQLQSLTGNEVTDGSSVAKITMNDEILTAMIDGRLPENFVLGEKIKNAYENINPYSDAATQEVMRNTGIYSGTYNGIQCKASYNPMTGISSYIMGPAKMFLNNIPEHGIEVYAFFENSGLKDPWSDVTHIHGWTGQEAQEFENPNLMTAQAVFNNGLDYLTIEITQGTDGKYYIYPDSLTNLN